VRSAIVLSLAFLLISTGVASAQTATPPGSSPAPSEPGRFSISAEALLWWFKDSPAPVPLVTDGLVGQPGTKTFLGGEDLDTGANPGFRLTAGYAFTERWGVEGSFFYIPSRSTSQSVSSSGQLGSTDLIVPFIDATTGRENGTEISFSPIFRGSATETLSNNLMGADLNATWALSPSGPWRVDLLGGFRWLRLHETYTLTTSSPFIPPFPQDIWNTTDEFDTINNFYGAQAGVRARFDWKGFFTSATVKFAMGAMVQSAEISGSLVTNDNTNFGPTQTFLGGYFALPSNIGNHTRTVFAVVPEIGLNIGYQITSWASVFVGYTFLYTNNVLRPGNQINRTINTSQDTAYTENPAAKLQGPAQPSFKFNSSDFWAQGINVGLAFRF
jgi:Putative beta barrel porin-7 (BBP7)